MTLGEKISTARKELGWTQNQLVKELEKVGLEVSYPWIASIETDRIRDLKIESRKALAKVFKKPPEYFSPASAYRPLDAVDDSSVARNKKHNDLIGPEQPVDFTEVIGIVSAETFKEPAGDAVRLDVIDYLYKRKTGRRTYALRISGSCMEPKASDGDYAVIEETTDVPDGTLAVICWDGECTLKRVYHRADHLELRPDNPEYKILRPKLKDCRIIGIVKSFHRKP